MTRSLFTALALLVVFAAAGSAQEAATGCCQGTCGAMDCPRMQMMGSADIAAWDGSVYMLSGGVLQKLNRQLEVAGTVELPDPGCMCATGGMCAASAQGQMDGQDRKMPMMQQMHAMHTKQMMGRTQLAVDGSGVYLLRGGKLTVFDHNLKEIRSEEVIAMTGDASKCPMCQKMMGRMNAGDGSMWMCPMCAEKMKAGGGAEHMCPMCAEKMKQIREGPGEN